MDKTFEPAQVEPRWLEAWDKAEIFRANPASGKPPFCIVIPPPNITGRLHIGHALNNTLQDVLVRWKRMTGHNVLWVPGSDHAGIATQSCRERALEKEGITRQALGREKFVERVWEWKEQYGGAIIQQLRRLGASCDWSRERFTMDRGLSRAVREVFVRLYEKGLIYRGDTLINWCPRCHTALSDLEVEHGETQGKLWTIALSGGRRRGNDRGGHDAPRDDAGRHGGGRASRRRALQGPDGQHGDPAAAWPRDPDRGRCRSWTRTSAPAR